MSERSSRLTSTVLATAVAIVVGATAPPTGAAASACAKYGSRTAKQLEPHQARAAIRCLFNRERARRGLSPLETDKRLQAIAQDHTELMMEQDCFAHQCPGEPP